MNNQNRKSLLSVLISQTLITFAYGFGLVTLILQNVYVRDFPALMNTLVKYLPEFFILFASLAPQLVLLMRHRLHSQDGEILPLLFTITALQAAMIIPEAVTANGYIFVFPEILLILERFSLIGSAALFLLSALRYYGFSSSSMPLYTVMVLSTAFLLSAIIPMASYKGEMNITSSPYEIYLQIAIALLYLATITTFIIIAVKDRTALNIKRSIAFIMMAIGLYVAEFSILGTAIASILLYIPGSIILLVNAGDSL